MKKIVTSLLIVVLLFNFICCRSVVYADPDTPAEKNPYTDPASPSNEGPTELIESGTASQKQGSSTKVTLGVGNAFATGVGMITGIVARIINIFIIQIDFMMGVMTSCEETTDTGTETQFWFTLDRVVFNRIPLFNANFFETEDYKVGDSLELEANNTNVEIKNGIIDVYKICRSLATIISLLVLIYIAIRMAISTVASDQAKYKKMFTSWVESIVILFCMVYIMIAVLSIGDTLTGIFYNIRCELIKSNQGYGVFEDTVRSQIWGKIFTLSGLQLTLWSIIYWCLLFSEIKFFWLYAKRLLMMGLLITVSPLIIITYSIDKAGDGRAQVFSSWMKEFVVNALIQPLHALIYLIFVLTANTIAIQAPLVALALLMSMGSVERMVKVVFDLKGLATLRGVNKFMKKEG